MGQVFSYLWSCLRPKLESDTKRISQNDFFNHLVSASIPNHVRRRFADNGIAKINLTEDAFVEVDVTPVLDKQIVVNKEVVISIPDACIQHVSGSKPGNITDDSVADLTNVDTNDVKKKEVDCDEEAIATVVEKNISVNKVIYNSSDYISYVSGEKIGPYNSDMEILLVGEGDFSFSACLAVAFRLADKITATSLNSEEFLLANYSRFRKNKTMIENRGGKVIHDINVKTMFEDPELCYTKYDCIIFNFPHACRFGKTDDDLRKHKDLIRGFFRNAKKMLNDLGEIHITQKSSGFYLNWNIPKIGSDHGLELIKEVKFKHKDYPGYHPKYGFGGDKNFNCSPSKTFVFRH